MGERPDAAQVVREVYEEWAAAGRVEDPADGGGPDDDAAFWAEVRRRLAGGPA